MVKQNIVGPLREQSDWEQNDEHRLGFIKNKPFYDTRKTESLTFTLPAPYTEAVTLDNGLVNYKISDKVPTYEEVLAGWVELGEQKVYLNEQGATEIVMGTDGSRVILIGGSVAVVFEESSKFTLGIWYFGSDLDGATLCFPSVTTGELKTIDPKYLPSGMGGGIPIIDISDIVSLGGEYQGGGELRFDLTENQVERIGSTLECKCFLFEVYDMQYGIMCTPYLINGVVCGYQGQLAIEGQVMLSFIVGVDSEPCIFVFSNPLTPAEE